MIEGPRVLVSGPLFTTSGGHPIATDGVDAGSDLVRVPTEPAEALRMVRTLAIGHDRVDVIKVVQERGGTERPLEPIPVDVLGAIVDEAHGNGLQVTAHWGTLEDLRLLDAGVDGLEHLESRDLLDGWPDELLAEVVERDLPFTATLVVSEGALPLDQVDDVVKTLQQRVGELHAAGGRVVVGSDAARPGVRFGAGVHRELELLVGSGMTPREALLAATVEAARVLGDDRLGAIAPGHAADVIVIGGDPTADIGAVRNVMMTLRDGRVVVHRRDG